MYREAYWRYYCSLIISARCFLWTTITENPRYTVRIYEIGINSLHCEVCYSGQNKRVMFLTLTGRCCIAKFVTQNGTNGWFFLHWLADAALRSALLRAEQTGNISYIGWQDATSRSVLRRTEQTSNVAYNNWQLLHREACYSERNKRVILLTTAGRWLHRKVCYPRRNKRVILLTMTGRCCIAKCVIEDSANSNLAIK